MADHELVDWVDNNDIVQGTLPRAEVLARRLIFRLADVVVIGSGDLLVLQQRSRHKARSPLQWTIGAGGFVLSGETYRAAAKREAEEELGVRADINEFHLLRLMTPLERGYPEFLGCFALRIPDVDLVKPDKREIEQVSWVSFDELSRLVETKELDFSPGFLPTWRHCRSPLERFLNDGTKNEEHQKK